MKHVMIRLLTAATSLTLLTACGAPSAPSSSAADSSQPSAAANASSSAPDIAKGDPNKKVILVVSFGTSYQDTRDATIGAIEQEIGRAFPDYEIRRAFTSQMIIDKLKKRDNLVIDNVTEAMERLVADGVGTLIVQPTHVMNGFEYDDAVREVSPYAAQFETFAIGRPLLSSTADYQAVEQALAAEYLPADDTALVLMGHGSEHFANASYAALAYHFLANGHKNILVGAVEGYPELNDVISGAQALGVRKVILAPLMVVAGDHASNDMAGDEEGSWKTAFKAAGFGVECILKGMGEYQSIRDIYVSHVRDAIEGDAPAAGEAQE